MAKRERVQGVLPYSYEGDQDAPQVTALAGLPIYLDLAHVAGLFRIVEQHVRTRLNQGWSDAQMVLALVLLNLAGGDCVEDIQRLGADKGFMQVFRRVEQHGLRRRERRELARRFRKGRQGDLPSPSSIFRWLAGFHDPEQEKKREEGKAFVPEPNEALQGMGRVIAGLVAFVQKKHPVAVATMDMDATLVVTHKENAKFGYKGDQAYQPLSVRWFEQGLTVYSEFRDGNVPAHTGQLRVLRAALGLLPSGVTRVRLRSDTAGYDHEMLAYCALGKDERFGVIEFCIGCDVSDPFKSAVRRVTPGDWHKEMRLNAAGEEEWTGREWAEVNYVPTAIAYSKKDPEYRFLAIRERLKQPALPGMGAQQKLPFPTIDLDEVTYKLHGVVTNMDWEGSELLRFHYQRCGKSEEAHAVHKDDFAGGKLPSGDFGENAAWWQIAVLTANLNEAMKCLGLGGNWVSKRMKAIRHAVINVPGRLLHGARQLVIRVWADHPSYALLTEARRRIAALAAADTS